MTAGPTPDEAPEGGAGPDPGGHDPAGEPGERPADGPSSDRAGPQGPGRLLDAALARVLVHLIDQHPNARRRLRAHAGRSLRMGLQDRGGRPIDTLSASLRIDELGGLRAAGTHDAPQAQLWLTLDAGTVASLARADLRRLRPRLRLEGDPLLAGLVAEILGDLRWDPEDDLAAVVGDVPARRLFGSLQAAREAVTDTGARAAGQFEEAVSRAIDRAGPLAPRSGFEDLQALLQELDARIRALEARRVPGDRSDP